MKLGGLLLGCTLLAAAFAAAGTIGPPPLFLEEWSSFQPGRPSLRQPTSIAASGDGSIYVLDWKGGAVLRFRTDGAFVSKWKVPRGLSHLPLNAIAANDNFVYVSDPASANVHAFTPEGVKKVSFPFECTRNGLAVDALGNVYVSGFHVEKTEREGPALWKLNRMGDVLGRWNRAAGPVAVDAQATVYGLGEIYERGPKSILRLDPVGGRLGEWDLSQVAARLEGDLEAHALLINGISVDRRGHVFLAVEKPEKIVELNPEGAWVRAWGDVSEDRRPLIKPSAVAVDTSGNLYVTDWALSRVVKYDPRRSP